MTPTKERDSRAPERFELPAIDRDVLFGMLLLAGTGFGAAWYGSRDFLPGAKLFPSVLSGVGIALTLFALIRVWRRVEPSGTPGREVPSEAQSRADYRKAVAILASIAGYFIGVYLIGFLPATVLLILVFARVYGQSYGYAAGAAAAAVGGVWALSFSMDLFLPVGALVQTIMGGRG